MQDIAEFLTHHLGCWMHAPRKIVHAQDNDPASSRPWPSFAPSTPCEKDLKTQRDMLGDRFDDAQFTAERQSRAGRRRRPKAPCR